MIFKAIQFNYGEGLRRRMVFQVLMYGLNNLFCKIGLSVFGAKYDMDIYIFTHGFLIEM